MLAVLNLVTQAAAITTTTLFASGSNAGMYRVSVYGKPLVRLLPHRLRRLHSSLDGRAYWGCAYDEHPL
jgi:hypothetical protein